jgi:hypothetical protein
MIGNNAINLASQYATQKGFSVDASTGRTDAVGNNTTALQLGRINGAGQIQVWRCASVTEGWFCSTGQLWSCGCLCSPIVVATSCVSAARIFPYLSNDTFLVGASCWFTLANVSGYTSINWFSKYCPSGSGCWVNTHSSLKASRIGASQDVRFYTSQTTGSGSTITWDERVRFANDGNVGIGTTAPNDVLDVEGNIRISSNKTNATNKTNRLRGQHYTNAEEPVAMMFVNSFASDTDMHIGGSSSIENAVTTMNFYTAANTTTTSGTKRMCIASNGVITSCGVHNVCTSLQSPIIYATNQICSDGNLTVKGNVIYHCGGSPEFRWGTASTHVNWRMAVQETISNAWEIGSGLVDADVSNDTFTRHLWVGTNYICGSCCFTAPTLCATSCIRTAMLCVHGCTTMGSTGTPQVAGGERVVLRGYSTQYDSGGSGCRLSNSGFLEFWSAGNWTGSERRWAITNAYCMGSSGCTGNLAFLLGGYQVSPVLANNGALGTGTSIAMYITRDKYLCVFGCIQSPIVCATNYLSSNGRICANGDIVPITNNINCLGVGDKFWKCGYIYYLTSSTVRASSASWVAICASAGGVFAATCVTAPTVCATAGLRVYHTSNNGHICLCGNDAPSSNNSAINIDFQTSSHLLARINSRYDNSGSGGAGGLRICVRDNGTMKRAINIASNASVYADCCLCTPTVCATNYLNTNGLIYVTQAADNDGIRFRGYDDANGYYGRIGVSDVGYLRIFAEGSRSIDLKSGRQIRFYTSLDNSTYTNSVNFNSDGTSTFSGDVTAPIVCATNYMRICNHYLCHSASGDLEIKSAGGDLDLTTWLRMRASSNGTVKGGWHNSTGRMCIGADVGSTGAMFQIIGDGYASGCFYSPTICATGTSGYTLRTAGCIYSSGVICSATCMMSQNRICSSGVICAAGGFYGSGVNLTGISAGTDTCEDLTCAGLYLGCCAGKYQAHVTDGNFCVSPTDGNVVVGPKAFYGNLYLQDTPDRGDYFCGSKQNTIMGALALHYGTRSGQNVVIGYCALYCTRSWGNGEFGGTSGPEIYGSVVIGHGALAGANSHCCGRPDTVGDNVYIGRSAGLYSGPNVCQNVVIGRGAAYGYNGNNCMSIKCNTILGAFTAGNNIKYFCNNIVIGHDVDAPNQCCCNHIVIGNSQNHTGTGKMCSGAFTFSGSVSKSSGSFLIAHPDPVKAPTKDLWHSFVESPNEGDNIYRYSLDVEDCHEVITLPDYYSHLNKNDQIWVSPVGHFGAAYACVTEDQKCAIVCTNADGCYNVLLIGTRKDPAAVYAWDGAERNINGMSPYVQETNIEDEDESSETYGERLCIEYTRNMSEYSDAYN